jgi:hypothetical protein
MNITRETIKSTLRTIMAEETEYQTFFKKALEKAGKSIPSMSDEEKKEFFNKIDAAWNAKGEKNEELTGNQHKLDVDGDGEIEASDLAALRAGKKKDESIEESASCSCGCGGCSESVNEAATDRDFEKVYSIFDKKDYFHLKGSIKTMLGNWQRALDRGDKGAQQYSKEDVIDSVTAQTKAGAKHTYDELVKAIKNKDIKALKSKLRHDQTFSLAIFTQVTGKKLPKSTRDIHSFLDNEFMNESITEGRAFINAARKAKEEGKTEFEFNGKTYPVTLKESLNEDANMNKKVKAFLDKGLRDLRRGGPNHYFAVMHVLIGALTDANFHSEAKKVPSIFPKAKYEGDPMGKQDAIGIYEEMGENIASICKWDGKDIVDAIGFYVTMAIGRPSGAKVEKLVESLTEARLGKVSLLKTVEKGDSSRVEGVKISPELAFELRMFLQRPMLARTRTGIAIDNTQMKDAIGMLAKVGVEKRLSSGVKNEFSNLLKKYNK